jgi:hypothetical protein
MLKELDLPGYPIGIPKVHIINEDLANPWTCPEHNNFPLALLKVFVVPPREIDVAVLPMKIEGNERLLFPLCATCALDFPDGSIDENYSCPHDDLMRGWVSTCTSIELNEALRNGYRVTKVIRVLEYTQSDEMLFRSYMKEFLCEKFHSSGFDENIRGNWEAEENFIKECMEKFEIEIDREKMKHNIGKRTLIKLCLNNLWYEWN